MLWYIAYVNLQYSCKQVNTHIKFHSRNKISKSVQEKIERERESK